MTSLRILIADDSATSRVVLQHALVELGHDCLVAKDGQEAWELYQETHPLVVISDWVMPGMDGTELCRRIRGADGAPYAYFIMLTGLESKEDVLRGIEAGADGYITKPLDPHDLRMSLIAAERVTALHQQLAEAQAAPRNEA